MGTSGLWFCKLNFHNFRRKTNDLICHCSVMVAESLVPHSFWKLKRLQLSSHSNQHRTPSRGAANEVISIWQSSALSSTSCLVALPCLKGGGWEVMCRITTTFLLHVGGAWAGQTPARPCLPFLRHNTRSHRQERFKTRISASGQLYLVEASARPRLSRLRDRELGCTKCTECLRFKSMLEFDLFLLVPT